MYIKKYNSIEEGYNIERTLMKIIKGEKIPNDEYDFPFNDEIQYT